VFADVTRSIGQVVDPSGDPAPGILFSMSPEQRHFLNPIRYFFPDPLSESSPSNHREREEAGMVHKHIPIRLEKNRQAERLEIE
jgi:hypothetical protein